MAPQTLTRMEVATSSAEQVVRALDVDDEVRITVARNGSTIETTIPRDLLPTVIAFLDLLARHGAVDVAPAATAIGTEEAARILNMSRPSVVTLLESGAIPFTKAGTHRRMLLSDVMAYRDDQYRRSVAAMREMAQIERELGAF